MNKKLLLVFTGVLLILSTCLYVFMSNEEEIVIASGKSDKSDKSVISTNALTMMYETEAGSGEYVVTSESVWPQEGYVFNENLSSCENCGTLSWNNETKRVVLTTSTSDKCYVYFDVYVPPTLADVCSTGGNLASCIQIYYATNGEGYDGLYYHDGVGTYTNADQEAEDNSYRYAGANPNNYVCFGSTASPCPTDNLYRIIGVFGDQVKLIKHDYATSALMGTNGDYDGQYTDDDSYYNGSNYSNIASYVWNVNRVNTWSTSQLNTVNLNTNYLNNIGRTWSSKIANHTWQVGGVSYGNAMNSSVKTAYTYEVGANTTYSAKIGLMYVSDYGYAASPANWSTNIGNLNNDTNRNNNWMFMGLDDWTISRTSDTSDGSWFVDASGGVYIGVGQDHAVRPTFYLNSNVTYVSGFGTSSDPIRIN